MGKTRPEPSLSCAVPRSRGPWQDEHMKAAEKSQKIRSELMILEALVVAMDRREELFAVLEESENDQQAHLVLGERLGLDEVQI